MFVAPYWLYALRYYNWLGDGELVHFETPLVGMAAGPSTTSTSVAGPSPSRSLCAAAEEVDAVGMSEPPALLANSRSVVVGRLISIDEEDQ